MSSLNPVMVPPALVTRYIDTVRVSRAARVRSSRTHCSRRWTGRSARPTRAGARRSDETTWCRCRRACC